MIEKLSLNNTINSREPVKVLTSRPRGSSSNRSSENSTTTFSFSQINVLRISTLMFKTDKRE